MLVLGDHQPNSLVSGTGVSHDVPVALLAHDPGGAPADRRLGLDARPAAGRRTASSGPMDAFRDRFLRAYGSTPSRPAGGLASARRRPDAVGTDLPIEPTRSALRVS